MSALADRLAQGELTPAEIKFLGSLHKAYIAKLRANPDEVGEVEPAPISQNESGE